MNNVRVNFCCSNKQACVKYNGVEYSLVFTSLFYILTDADLSWESKGVLSHICNITQDLYISDSCIENLISAGYLVEAQE